MRRSTRTLLAASAAGALLAVAPATAPRAAAATSACATQNLVVWLDTRGGGAAGSVYYALHLTNLGRHACTLRGYPGVSAVDLAGRRLGSAAARDAAQPSRTVLLQTGATATATLRIVDVLNYPRSRCSRAPAAGLRVYPPGQTLSRVVPFPFSACARPGPAYLAIRAVRR